MFALHGLPAGVDVFRFQLAEKLHKSVQEIEALPHEEVISWAAYFTAKSAIESVRR